MIRTLALAALLAFAAYPWALLLAGHGPTFGSLRASSHHPNYHHRHHRFIPSAPKERNLP